MEVQIWLKSYKNTGHFECGSKHILCLTATFLRQQRDNSAFPYRSNTSPYCILLAATHVTQQ